MDSINKDDVFEYELRCEVVFKGFSNFPAPKINLPDSAYSHVTNKLFACKQVAPIEWGEKRYKFKFLNKEDKSIIISAVKSIPDLMENRVLPIIFGDNNFSVESVEVTEVSIGCVKVKYVMSVIALGAAAVGLANDGFSFHDKWIKDPSKSVTVKCEGKISSAQSLSVNIKRVIENNPSKLLEDDKNCIKIRQMALKKLGYYHGSIDGVVGDKTLSAEALFATRKRINVANVVEIYRAVANELMMQGV